MATCTQLRACWTGGGSAAGEAGSAMTAAASLTRNPPSSWMVLMNSAGEDHRRVGVPSLTRVML
jgi:hypothetical protein